ncbi:MAG: cation-transporting P-type ATPase, partial [Aggregatilineales bacterium]
MAQTILSPPEKIEHTAQHAGLSQSEVQERLERGESNDFQARVGRSYRDIFVENVLNLFNIVLGSLLIVVIAFQDYATAFFAGFSVVTNTFLGMLQEMNAKRKLDNLATLSEQEVDVIRGGKRETISMRAVVLDDLIIIEPGNRLVVDGIIVKSDSLEIDESLLTGES